MKAIDVTSCQHAGMALSTINPPARNDTWLNRLQSFVTLKPPASPGTHTAMGHHA